MNPPTTNHVKMHYKFELITENDLPSVCELVLSAKMALSINRALFLNWPNEQLQRRLYSTTVRSGFMNPSFSCFKAVDKTTKEIVGFMAINKKEPPQEGETPEQTSQGAPPSDLNLPLFNEINDAVKEIATKTDNQAVIQIVYMCVKPSVQRRGIGKGFVNLAIGRATCEMIPLAVCAEGPSVPFFTKMGLKETHHVDIDLQKYAAGGSELGTFRLSAMIDDVVLGVTDM